ncbi:MAG: triose-phosphate isomerase [Dehalococcoidia bacterium]
MRTPFVAGNWKMNTTVSEAEELVSNMRGRLDGIEGVDKVLCPPFISLTALNRIVRGSSIRLGAQNMHFETKGAYTGEISPLMLGELCEFVILGHSERRMYFGETDEVVNRKVKAALAGTLTPILCIGERLEENEAGRTEEVLERQLTKALDGVEPAHESRGSGRGGRTAKDMVIAYEPIWAIGTGRAASGEQAAATIGFVRGVLTGLWGGSTAEGVRILYGGSVTGTNIAEFVSHRDIDGALVGGASLKAEEFLAIVGQTAETRGSAG